MKKREWSKATIALAALLVGAYCVLPDREFVNPSIPVAALEHQDVSPTRTNPVREALESVFQLRFSEQNNGGSAFLVGRTRTDNGFRYRAITAYHVVDDILPLTQGENPIALTPDIAFHSWSKGIMEEKVVIKTEAMSQDMDWYMFSFESKRDMPCLTLSDAKVFNDLAPTDDLYLIGSEDLRGVIVFECNLAAPSNKFPTPDDEQFKQESSDFRFHQFPHAYFRVSHSTIPGASGGVVIDTHGRVVGVVTAYIQQTSLALKASIILSQIGASSDLLLVEK